MPPTDGCILAPPIFIPAALNIDLWLILDVEWLWLLEVITEGLCCFCLLIWLPWLFWLWLILGVDVVWFRRTGASGAGLSGCWESLDCFYWYLSPCASFAKSLIAIWIWLLAFIEFRLESFFEAMLLLLAEAISSPDPTWLFKISLLASFFYASLGFPAAPSRSVDV